MSSSRIAERWVQPQDCCDPEWEEAYARFEKPDEERRKFLRRLRRFGADCWDRDLLVVELFCGRGGGLAAWSDLGYRHLEGVDLSENLLGRYDGEASLYLGDCRQLKLPDASRDVVCVQGGLHHLGNWPDDLRATVNEAWRVLRTGGRFLVVEPWLTGYLRAVHWACEQRGLRRSLPKLDALARMIEREKVTYADWLSRPDEIRGILGEKFQPEIQWSSWGKLCWLGRKPAGA